MKHTIPKNLKKELISALASDIKESDQMFEYFLIQELRKRLKLGREEVVERDNIVINSKNANREFALAKAEEKIGEALAESGDSGDNTEKYKNIDSILKYVENPNDKGQGVKLVIMNFND